MLDITTPRGQETLGHEARAAEIWHSHYPHMAYVETPKDQPASIDAILVTPDNAIAGAVEQKSRDMTFSQLARWDNEWLVTRAKLDAARMIAVMLRVPVFGFLYMIPEDALIVRRIWNADGTKAAAMRSQATTTQRTVNGGSIERENAFVNMTGALYMTLQARGTLGTEAA